MLDSITQAFDQIGSWSFWICVAALVVIDLAAIAAVAYTRSRELVNRWTARILAANLMLLGAGLGVPAASFVAKSVVVALAPSVQPRIQEIRQATMTPAK
jgi:hypothetical protein